MKQKPKKTTISIDTEVWSEINRRLRIGTRDNKNKVLRRLLGLDKDCILVIEGIAEITESTTLNKFVTTIDKISLLEYLERIDFKYPKKVRITVEEIK